MNQVNIEEPGLLKIDTKEIEMSMQIDLHGLSFCLLHKPENKILALNFIPNKSQKPIHDFFLEVWSSNKLIQNDYADYKFVYVNRRVSLVPVAMFKEEDVEKIFSFNFKKDENEVLSTATLNRSEANVIFGIPTDLYNTVNSQVSCKWLPHILPFIETNLKDYRLANTNLPVVYVACNSEFLDILVVDDKGIKLYNNFYMKSANDIVYYVLNVYDKLKLNPEKVQIVFCGDITAESSSIISLQKFIRQVFFAVQRQDLKYSYRMQDIAPHYFTNLINLSICEL